jgi:hypothetical protein
MILPMSIFLNVLGRLLTAPGETPGQALTYRGNSQAPGRPSVDTSRKTEARIDPRAPARERIEKPRPCEPAGAGLQRSPLPAAGRSRECQDARNLPQRWLELPHLPVVDGLRIGAQPNGDLLLEEPQV